MASTSAVAPVSAVAGVPSQEGSPDEEPSWRQVQREAGEEPETDVRAAEAHVKRIVLRSSLMEIPAS